MPRVSHHFVVDRPIDAVFDVVTTARFWPEWHPATRGVEGDTGRPARFGDQITEYVTIAGIQGSGTWTAVEHDHRLAHNPHGETRGAPRRQRDEFRDPQVIQRSAGTTCCQGTGGTSGWCPSGPLISSRASRRSPTQWAIGPAMVSTRNVRIGSTAERFDQRQHRADRSGEVQPN